MNVRLSAGEVRLRVDRAEAEALARGEPLAESVAFPGGGRFAWRVEPRGEETSAVLQGGEMLVVLAADAMRDLLARPPSKDAGVFAELTLDGSAKLRLAIEIDLHGGRKR